MASIIVPAKLETQSVRNGRAILKGIIGAVLETVDRGKEPTRVVISTAHCDDLRAFFDYAYDVFDGVLPKTLHGVPIEYEPGAFRRIRVECK